MTTCSMNMQYKRILVPQFMNIINKALKFKKILEMENTFVFIQIEMKL